MLIVGPPKLIRKLGHMQRPDDKKRLLILESAGKLFASRPFHKVTLDDIAAEAGVGKGTLYVYFPSKEELFSAIVREGFAQIVQQLRKRLEGPDVSAEDGLRHIVAELFRFAFAHPDYFELMRTAPGLIYKADPRWWEMFTSLTRLIEDMISAGVRSGEFVDPHPELTALLIPGLVRSLMLFGPAGLDEKTAFDHVMAFLRRGLAARGDGRRASVTATGQAS